MKNLCIVFRVRTMERFIFYNDKSPEDNLVEAVVIAREMDPVRCNRDIIRSRIRADHLGKLVLEWGIKDTFIADRDHSQMVNTYLNGKNIRNKINSNTRRNDANKACLIECGLSPDSVILIIELCRLRHIVHCNMDNILLSDVRHHTMNRLYDLVSVLEDAGLPPLELPVKIEDLAIREKWIARNSSGDVDPESPMYLRSDYLRHELDAWNDRMNEIGHEQMYRINYAIEEYLSRLDEKYGCNLTPTGVKRCYQSSGVNRGYHRSDEYNRAYKSASRRRRKSE